MNDYYDTATRTLYVQRPDGQVGAITHLFDAPEAAHFWHGTATWPDALPVPVSSWHCTYCRGLAPGDTYRCDNCGAPRA